MSRRLITGFSLAALCLSAIAMAQAPAPPAQTTTPAAPPAPAVIGPAKIAWIDLEQAIVSVDEGKREFGEMQKYVEKKTSELQALQKELETLRNQLSVQGAKLTDEARADLQEQIEAKETIAQRFQQDTQKDIDSRRVRTTNFIGRKMLPVIEKLSKEKGLSAVVYINPSRDAWIDPALVITSEVIKAYNAAYPVAAAPAPATNPARPKP